MKVGPVEIVITLLVVIGLIFAVRAIARGRSG
jgi:hypothetical protein